MDQEILDKINNDWKPLRSCTRGIKGQMARKETRVVPVLREGTAGTPRNWKRCEPSENAFRKDLHDLRAAACMELRQLYGEYAERLAEMYRHEADAFCELRDKSCAEIDERLARLDGEQA